MRFMMLVKSAENVGRPPKELMDAMAKISEEAAKANTMVDSGGLAPTAMSQRVRLSRGNITVLDGPFTEAKEVVGGYAQFEFKTKKEATEAAVRLWNSIRDTGQAGRARLRSARCSNRARGRLADRHAA